MNPIDIIGKIEYITIRNKIVDAIKKECLNLASLYGSNLKIEVDVNAKVDSIKISIKEHL